jgi:hypothetical protein
MNRPVGIAVTSILQFMFGLVYLLLGVLCFTGQYFVPKMSKPEVPIGFLSLAFAAIGIATAVGVFRLKRWSRYLTLIFAGMLVCGVLLISAVLLFSPAASKQPTSTLPDGFAVGLMVVGLGGWWLYYFNRKDIRAWFQGKTATGMANGSSGPLSITVLALLNLLALPFVLVEAWKASPIPIFGVVVQGGPARLIDLLFAGLALYLGIGLLRLVPASRLVAIGYYIYEFVASLLFYVLPGAKERYIRVSAESWRVWQPQHMGAQSALIGGAWTGLILSTVFSAVPIYFLITRRFAFERSAITGQPPD